VQSALWQKFAFCDCYLALCVLQLLSLRHCSVLRCRAVSNLMSCLHSSKPVSMCMCSISEIVAADLLVVVVTVRIHN